MKKVLLISSLLFALSCGSSKEEAPKTATNLTDVNSVDMLIEPGPGSEEFIANCQTCHTARYVLMQPRLSRKAWEKSVDKMIHVFGADIDSLTAKRIVDYLVNRQGG